MPVRCAKINTLWLMLISAGAAVAVLVGLLSWGSPDRAAQADVLEVYCAAGLRPAMEKIAAMYQDEYGVRIQFQFGGSNTLLNQMEVNKFDTADLYLAADDYYSDLAVEKGLAAETLSIAEMRPVVAVRQDSTRRIESLEDLLQEGISIVVADPEQAALGRAVRDGLSRIKSGETDRWQQLHERVTAEGVFKPTVNDAANDVKIGAVDAAIVWDSTVAMPQYRDVLKAVPIPELDGEPSLIVLCVLHSSRKPTAALKFARYVSAHDRGLPVFAEFGMRPVEGDAWAERPQVNFFCGAVNRRAVERIVAEFQAREGVDVNTIYDGCGILTSRMKTFQEQRTDLGFPDVYMACDLYYLDNVKDWFQDAANISETEIVIAIPKGSEKVAALADLVRPGVRVAVGEPDQCTIGALTRRLLAREGLYEALKEKQLADGETVVEKPSSALLVPDVVTGHVDAAVAYLSDVRPNLDRVDVVPIDSPLNKAVQPYSIARTSGHKHLLRRLYKRIESSPDAFESAGFQFRLGDEQNGVDSPRSHGDTE